MKKLNKFVLLLTCFFCINLSNIFAERTSVENLYQYTLENGLTVFEAENHAVPLVYIEITVKTGAKDQTPETAGLFHLYEHMMFKGNALYTDAAQVQRALSELGVTNWNGTTGTDCVNYFFTIPSDRIEDGLAFWNAAIRSPNMDEYELSNEKKVVLSEISGNTYDPSSIYQNNIYNLLFPEAPYRVSAGGSLAVIKNATVAQLMDIKEKYYIPSNAALFIGGDIEPEQTYELVKKIWGDWSNNGRERPEEQKQMNLNPLKKTTALVMPYDQMSPQTANIAILFRGPDTNFNLEDTYAADYFCQLMEDPEGIFVQDLYSDKELMIPGAEYIWQTYQTVKQNGTIQFGTTVLSPEQNLPERSLKMLSDITDSILPKICDDKDLYSQSKINSIAQNLMDQDAIVSDTATGLLTNLRFWWIATSPEYYYSYNDKILQVTQKDVQKFINKYLTSSNALVTVLVNPSVYEATKEQYEKAGFIVADATKAAWWNDEKYAPDKSKIEQINTEYKNKISNDLYENIYVPEPIESRPQIKVKSIADGVKTLRLRNGIPVYIKNDKSKKLSTIQIAVKDGSNHATPETAGLEEALFEIMSNSSDNYNFETRQILNYKTKASISSSCSSVGSIISLNVLNHYLDQMLPVFIDGFINPNFDQQVYENLMNGYINQVQLTLNDPQSLLVYTALKETYKDAPFNVDTSVTPESLENITIENMQLLHRVILDPANIFIMAVGNFDEKELINTLNKNIGLLAATKIKAPNGKPVPPLKIEQKEPVVMDHESAKDSGYVMRVFESPSLNDDNFVAACIAANIYSDIMFSVVRESHGVCYTPYSDIFSSKSNLGLEILMNLSNYEDFSFAMNNARQLMALGMIINGKNPGGSYSFEPLENVLESYKNKFINSTYSSQATTASTASTLTSSLLYYNNIKQNDKQIEQIREVTAKQIKEVFKKYWIDSPTNWYVIVGPEDKDKIIFMENY